jgi:nucleotide-binding universal stress UspA family protein
MGFSKILCPTDFSDGSRHALRVAIRLAIESGAELVIVNALFVPAIMYSEYTVPGDVIQQMVDDSRRGLEAAVQEATAAGATRVSSRSLRGVPWSEIVAELEREGYDLCVVGTHGRTGIARFLVGSVAEKVIRHAPCSVLAIRPDGGAEPFTHALVPLDFSARSEEALALASSLIPAEGTITLLHVIEVPVAARGQLVLGTFARDLDKHAATALDSAAARMATLTRARMVRQTRIGAVADQIVETLDGDRSVDLVVMGSHGRTGIKRAVMGSVAERVVRHARCSVLVARTHG